MSAEAPSDRPSHKAESKNPLLAKRLGIFDVLLAAAVALPAYGLWHQFYGRYPHSATEITSFLQCVSHDPEASLQDRASAAIGLRDQGMLFDLAGSTDASVQMRAISKLRARDLLARATHYPNHAVACAAREQLAEPVSFASACPDEYATWSARIQDRARQDLWEFADPDEDALVLSSQRQRQLRSALNAADDTQLYNLLTQADIPEGLRLHIALAIFNHPDAQTALRALATQAQNAWVRFEAARAIGDATALKVLLSQTTDIHLRVSIAKLLHDQPALRSMSGHQLPADVAAKSAAALGDLAALEHVARYGNVIAQSAIDAVRRRAHEILERSPDTQHCLRQD